MNLVEIPESTGRRLIPIQVDPVYEAAQMATEGMSDTEKFLARTGRIMGGTYRGIKQILGGDTPEMADDRLREKALAESQGNLGGFGAHVLGALADPVTAPLFAVKAPASLVGWAGQGALFGGAQGALAETSPGDSRVANAAVGAAGGAVVAPVAGKLLNMAGRGAVTGANRVLGTDFAVPGKIPVLPAARVSQDVADTVSRKLIPIGEIAPVERKLVPVEDIVPESKVSTVVADVEKVVPEERVIPAEVETKRAVAKYRREQPEPKELPGILSEIKKMGGISSAEGTIRDITGETRTGKGVRGIPPGLFHKNGRGLDELATRLRENGYLIPEDASDDGVQVLKDMIRDEVQGVQRHYSAFDEEAVYRQMAERARGRFEDQDFNLPEVKAAPENEQNAVIVMADELVAKAPDNWGKLTEEQKNAHLDEIFGADTATVATSKTSGEGAIQGATGSEAPKVGKESPFFLTPETEAQIQAREALQRQADEVARRKANAPPPSEFVLSGSNRATDEAVAHGQTEFSPGTLGMNIAPSQVKKTAQATAEAWTKYAGKPLHELVQAYPGTSGSAVTGMIGGWNTADDDATTIEKTGRAAAGFLLGALAGRGIGMIPAGGKNVSEWLSRGIRNNYGRNADVVAAEDAMKLFRSEAGAEWVELVKEVGKMDAVQRRALYQMMQGEAPQQADLLALNDRARETITKFGRMMVDAGMLDAKTQAKNEATYLHREYTSKLEASSKSGVSDKIAKFAASELRPRGIMFDVPEAQAQKYIEVGAELWDKPKNGIVTLRRQLTKPERESLGEIEDAGYAIARTGQLMTHDLSVYKFYADLANNPKVAQDINPGGWIQIQEGKVSGTKLNKFGNLEGKFVPQEVYDDLKQLRFVKQLSENPAMRWYLNVNAAWKAGKTALNPTVHVNNIMSNFVLYDLSDSAWGALGQAGKQMLRGGREYELAKSLGVFNANMAQQELRWAAKAAMDEYGGIQASGSINSALNFARKTWDVTGGKMIKAYQGEDNIFRLGVFIDRLRKGESPEQSAAEAKRWLIDYDINAPVIQAARNTVLPFIAYTYRAVPLLAEAATERPWKFAKWAALGFALNAVGEKYGGGDTQKERVLMSQKDKGNVFGMPFFPPQMIKSPASVGGTPQYLDITRWIPGGDVMDVSSENKMIPFLPQPLQPGGMAIAGVQAGLGYDQFTGKKLVGLGLSDAEDAKIKGKYLAQQFLPNNPLVPGSFAQDKIIRSAAGQPSPMGDALPVWQAVLQTVGIKLKPADLNKMQMRATFEVKQDVDVIREQIASAMREMQGGKMTQEQFQRYSEGRMTEAVKRVQQLQKRLEARP